MRENGGKNRRLDMILRSFSNVWLKPPLDPTLVRVLRRIAMNGLRCFLSGELLSVRPCFMNRSSIGSLAVNRRLLKGPQELGEVLLVFKVRFKNHK